LDWGIRCASMVCFEWVQTKYFAPARCALANGINAPHFATCSNLAGSLARALYGGCLISLVLAATIPSAALIVELFLETNLRPLRHVQTNLPQSALFFPNNVYCTMLMCDFARG
jgi:hypothetical protein